MRIFANNIKVMNVTFKALKAAGKIFRTQCNNAFKKKSYQAF